MRTFYQMNNFGTIETNDYLYDIYAIIMEYLLLNYDAIDGNLYIVTINILSPKMLCLELNCTYH